MQPDNTALPPADGLPVSAASVGTLTVNTDGAGCAIPAPSSTSTRACRVTPQCDEPAEIQCSRCRRPCCGVCASARHLCIDCVDYLERAKEAAARALADLHDVGAVRRIRHAGWDDAGTVDVIAEAASRLRGALQRIELLLLPPIAAAARPVGSDLDVYGSRRAGTWTGD